MLRHSLTYPQLWAKLYNKINNTQILKSTSAVLADRHQYVYYIHLIRANFLPLIRSTRVSAWTPFIFSLHKWYNNWDWFFFMPFADDCFINHKISETKDKFKSQEALTAIYCWKKKGKWRCALIKPLLLLYNKKKLNLITFLAG